MVYIVVLPCALLLLRICCRNEIVEFYRSLTTAKLFRFLCCVVVSFVQLCFSNAELFIVSIQKGERLTQKAAFDFKWITKKRLCGYRFTVPLFLFAGSMFFQRLPSTVQLYLCL